MHTIPIQNEFKSMLTREAMENIDDGFDRPLSRLEMRKMAEEQAREEEHEWRSL